METTEPMVLVLGGKRGLLGQAVVKVLRECGYQVVAQGQEDMSPFSTKSLREGIDRFQPDWLINTVGYNHVAAAERNRDLAYALNVGLPGKLAQLCRYRGVNLVHYSSDLVFDGRKQAPYTPQDRTNPVCFFGWTKFQGERAIEESGLSAYLLLRTSWLFGPWKANFVRSVLERAGKDNILPLVHDQFGSPTYTLDLAYYTQSLLRCGETGVYHLCNRGRASWCELAAEALAATEYNSRVEPVSSEEAGGRQGDSGFFILDSSKFTQLTSIKPRSWLQALRDYMFRFQSELVCQEPCRRIVRNGNSRMSGRP